MNEAPPYVDPHAVTTNTARPGDAIGSRDRAPLMAKPLTDEALQLLKAPPPGAVLVMPPHSQTRILDADGATRKTYPMARGLLDYFPDALAEVSKLSFMGNQKHNPGEEMHHARGKSTDHADCILRHLVGRGGYDGDTRESASLAWRALALLQEELEAEFNLPLPRGARE